MSIKAQANLQNKSALDFKAESKHDKNDESLKSITRTDYSYIGSNLAIYMLFTGATLAGLLSLQKFKTS